MPFRGMPRLTCPQLQPVAARPGACAVVLGCTNPHAANYYNGANRKYDALSGRQIVCHFLGCAPSTRSNYDPSATVDSGTACTPCTRAAPIRRAQLQRRVQSGRRLVLDWRLHERGERQLDATFDDGSCV